MKIINIKTDMIYAEYFEDMGYTYARDGFVVFLVAEKVKAEGYSIEYNGRAIYRLTHCRNADKVHVYFVGGGDEIIKNDFVLEVTKLVREVAVVLG